MEKSKQRQQIDGCARVRVIQNIIKGFIRIYFQDETFS